MKLDYVKNDIAEVLYTKEQIEKRMEELGAEITRDYKGKNPLLVAVLKGGAHFLIDLIKYIDTHVEIDYMTVSSYGNSTESSGKIKLVMDLDVSIEGRDVIIVEDLIDTGLTLHYLHDLLQARNPKSLNIFAFIQKNEATKKDVDLKYVGFDCPNKFIVGYGFDYDQMYRNLDCIGVLNPEVYQNNGGKAEVLRRAIANNK
jgi:hypoxanthine phosphoribosyltransferase